MQTKTNQAKVAAIAPPAPDFTQEPRSIRLGEVTDITYTAISALNGIVALAKGCLAIMSKPGNALDITTVAAIVNEIWGRAERASLDIEAQAEDVGVGEEWLGDPMEISLIRKYGGNGDIAQPISVPPLIGTYWHGLGGIYRGIARAELGLPEAYLIEAEARPHQDELLDHAGAVVWGASITADGHSDFHLASSVEALQVVAGGYQFKYGDRWCWTSTGDRPHTAYFIDECSGLDVHERTNKGGGIAVRRVALPSIARS